MRVAATASAAAPRRAAVDTGALLALASTRDQYHRRAVATEARFRMGGGRWLGTTLVLGELHGHLLRRLEPTRARQIVGALLADPIYEWVDAGVDLVRGAVDHWMTSYSDQAISLTDAVTFELMQREKIEAAFAYDQHFVTVGYRLLD